MASVTPLKIHLWASTSKTSTLNARVKVAVYHWRSKKYILEFAVSIFRETGVEGDVFNLGQLEESARAQFLANPIKVIFPKRFKSLLTRQQDFPHVIEKLATKISQVKNGPDDIYHLVINNNRSLDVTLTSIKKRKQEHKEYLARKVSARVERFRMVQSAFDEQSKLIKSLEVYQKYIRDHPCLDDQPKRLEAINVELSHVYATSRAAQSILQTEAIAQKTRELAKKHAREQISRSVFGQPLHGWGGIGSYDVGEKEAEEEEEEEQFDEDGEVVV